MNQEVGKFPKEVRRSPDNPEWMIDWEKYIKSDEDAVDIFKEFQVILREHGIDLTKNVRVLEVGSGNAVLIDFLQKQGVNITGIDARPRRSGDEKVAPQVMGRIEQLPFPNNSFDVVLSIAVFDLEPYDQNQDIMMKEIARILKPGGVYLGFNESDRMGIMPQIKEIKGFTLIPNDDNYLVYKKLA